MDVDVEQMKATLLKRYERGATMRPHFARPARGAAGAEIDAELDSLLESEPALAKLGALLTRRLDERRAVQKRAQAEQLAQAGTDKAAAKIADAIEEERTALGLLSKEPNTETFVSLDKPMFILQLPQGQFSQFKDQHIEPFNSWFKVDIETDRGGVGPEATLAGGETSFVAYYLWENPTDHFAVGSATCNMTLNGTAAAWGSPGKLDGNWALLDVGLSLTPIRWTGWGTDSAGNNLDGTTYPLEATEELVSWACYGGDWFSDDSNKGPEALNMFNQLTVPVIAIPGGAVIVFELSLSVDWGFVADWGDGKRGAVLEYEIDDGIMVDLASRENKASCGPIVLDLRV